MAMFDMIPFDRSFFGPFFNDFDRDMTPRTSTVPFRTDIQDCGDHFELQAELPGFRKEDIALNLENGVLTISAKREATQQEKEKNFIRRERTYGTYTRSFSVSGIQEHNITASYQDGVLTLVLPKQQKEVPTARQIEIQ